MPDETLSARNAYLTEMLKRAGADAKAHVVAAQIQRLLTEEIHHRMKNMLAIIAAIVRQSLRSSANLAEADAAIGVRLLAMSKAHDLLLKAELKAARLSEIVRGAIEQHDTAAGRIFIHGDDVEIIPASILPLCLILNELCTNATKYGALSRQGGSIAIAWTLDGSDLVLRWIEKGGPAVVPPKTRNLGTRLTEEAVPRQLGGKGVLSFLPAGVEFELVVPLAKLRPLIPEPLLP